MNIKNSNLAMKRLIIYITFFILLFLGFIILRNSTWQGSTQLHTLMELLATTLALFVGAMALIHFYVKKNIDFLYIGSGFLGTSFLDGYHTIVTSIWFNQLWPSPPPSLIPWSWNASRIFLSVLMFLSWWMWEKRKKTGEAYRINEKSTYISIGVLTLLSFFFFAFVPLPTAYYPKLLFGRPEEFFSAIFFLLALIGYLKKGFWKNNHFEHWIVLSLIVGFMCQAMFMSFSFNLFDAMFDIAHLLKKASYICVLIGLLISMYLHFRQNEDSKEQIVAQGILLKQAQDALIRKEKFAVIGRVSGSIAHDIRHPLTTIKNSSYFLNVTIKNPDQKMKKHLKLIDSEVTHANEIITSFLRLSQTRAPEKSRVNTNEYVREFFAEFPFPERIKLTLELDNECCDIIADRLQLRQVIDNITTNSVRAMPDDGTLTVKTRRVLSSEQRLQSKEAKVSLPVRQTGELQTQKSELEGDLVEISFADSGSGIKKEILDKIFEPFFTTKSEGIGLGLSIVKDIITSNGGIISVESEECKGSTFKIMFPAVL